MKMLMYVKEVHIVVKVFHDTLHSHWIYWKRSFIDREIKPTKILCKSTFCAIDMISNYKQQEQDACGNSRVPDFLQCDVGQPLIDEIVST